MMNFTNPFARCAFLALTFVLPGAVLAGPPKLQPGKGEYMKDEAIGKSLEQFALLAESLRKDPKYKNNPNLETWVKYVEESKENFASRAESFLPDVRPGKGYKGKEFRVMSELVAETITQIKAQVDLQIKAVKTGMSEEEYRFKSLQISVDSKAKQIRTLQANNMAPALDAALPSPAGSVQTDSSAMAPRPRTLEGVVERRATYQSMSDAERQAYEERMEADLRRDSLIVMLGVQSATCAVDHSKCVKDPPKPEPVPNPAKPEIPSDPDPAHPLPNPTGAGPNSGPSNESVVNEAVNTVRQTGGTNALASQSIAALERGDYGEAVSLARMALRFDPRNQNALGVIHSAEGRGDAIDAKEAGMRAANAGASALGTGPGPEGYGAAGVGPASASPEIAALAAAGATRVSSEQSTRGAMGALRLGDAPAALDILNKALAADPNNPGLLNLRATTYAKLGRYAEAAADAARGLEIVPNNPALLVTKSFAENRSRRYKDALASANLALAAEPRNAWAFANRAYAEAGLGDKAAMQADLDRAAALDPRFQKVARDAAQLVLPSDSDVIFLFPGESAKSSKAAPVASTGRGRSFGVIVGAGIAGGLLLAFGLLSTVLAPLKDTVVSAFTRVKRTAPATQGAVATAQPASVAGNVGGLIRGQYEIARQIGAGGMGMVYEGTDRSLGRRVAIKKMREELRLNARERDRFIIEAKTVASLHHPNIVDIYAIAEEGEDVYLVFEYVDGKTVHDLVQTAGRLEIGEAVRITRAMGEALTYAHSKGVIHRDMKPSNVMLTGGGAVKVMDFGIARMAKDAMTRYSMTNTVVGTPPYMAPEQEQGVVRKESDVYALAICAYEMLTGKLPFIGMGAGMLMNKINMSYIPPSRNIAGLPEALDEVFLKAFQADPEQRYRTPLEFTSALSAVLGGERSSAKPV